MSNMFYLHPALNHYYGSIYVEKIEDKYYMCMENYDEPSKVEISKEFYDACIKEFEGKE